MLKRAIIVLALVATVAIPFVLRPRRPAPGEADDTVVIITPHNEAIRHEFGLAFQQWYHARTGRTVAVDWRMIGGTSEIARYLEGESVASFRNLWTGRLGRAWSAEIQSAFQNGRLPEDAPAEDRQARAAYLASEAGCGIDLFFGGGSPDFTKQARAGRLVDSGLGALHPEWFSSGDLPLSFRGEPFSDPGRLWYGAVLSSFGIVFNRDALRRIGFEREPSEWSDLADPRFFGQIGLCDPTKSGSITVAFENVIQQQMHRRLDRIRAEQPGLSPAAASGLAARQGWVDALRLLQKVGANARYFTDTSQKPPIDVAAGDCAAGMCIDFYGTEQQEAVRRRGGGDRVGYVSPEGGAAYSVDPIGLLRGAPHPQAAKAFMEFVLSLDGQKLWNFRTGTPGGPVEFAIRRLPVRRDFYGHTEWRGFRSDPDVFPYGEKAGLVYNRDWTGALYLEIGFVVRVMTEDTHAELARAWYAVNHAPEPARGRALEALQDMSAVDYDRCLGPIRKALESKNLVDALNMARDLDAGFRERYALAERLASGAPLSP
jgi:ABC-type Fe3+ transport system substrate-binding protein